MYNNNLELQSELSSYHQKMKAYILLLLITIGLFSGAISYPRYARYQYSAPNSGQGGSNYQYSEFLRPNLQTRPNCDATSFSYGNGVLWTNCIPCVDAELANNMGSSRGPPVPNMGFCKFDPNSRIKAGQPSCGGN
jgi:hypothetical protein